MKCRVLVIVIGLSIQNIQDVHVYFGATPQYPRFLKHPPKVDFLYSDHIYFKHGCLRCTVATRTVGPYIIIMRYHIITILQVCGHT